MPFFLYEKKERRNRNEGKREAAHMPKMGDGVPCVRHQLAAVNNGPCTGETSRHRRDIWSDKTHGLLQ